MNKKPPAKKRILLPANVKAMGVVSLLNDASSEIIYPFLPIFLTETLKASVSFFGLIEGIAESTASVLKLFSGWFSDRLGKRKPLGLAGYGLSSLSRPLLALCTAPWQALLIRFSDRVGKGLRTTPRDALIADSCSERQRGSAYGFHRAMDHTGAVIGPLLASLLLALGLTDLRRLFWVASVPAVLCVITFAIFVSEKKPRTRRQPPSFSLKPYSSRFRFFLVAAFIFSLANSSDTFLLLRAKTCDITLAALPLLWAWLHVVRASSTWQGGLLSDRIGRTPLLVAGWLLYGLVYWGFGLAYQAWHIWLLFTVYGLFSGLTEGAERAFVADLAPQSLRGTAFGLYHLSLGLAALPASLLMGFLWDKVGIMTAFATGSALAFTAGILLLLIPKK